MPVMLHVAGGVSIMFPVNLYQVVLCFGIGFDRHQGFFMAGNFKNFSFLWVYAYRLF